MNSQVQQIVDRIRELREILEVTQQQVADAVKVPLEEYLKYENGKIDIPIGVLYAVADFLKVDPTELLTGECPRMTSYTIVRDGKGVSVERYKGYKFTSLAFNYINRDMEPMIVDLSPKDTPPELVSHSGQEFNYVLEGKVVVTIGDKEFVLQKGDSIYFDPSVLHGQHALENNAKFLTVINE